MPRTGISPAVKPFMKYMGGKRRLLKKALLPNVPESYSDYYEPFLGGGALAIQQMSAYDTMKTQKPRRFILSDYSQNVVDTWTAVRDFPVELAAELKAMLSHHCEEYFLSVRHWDRDGLLETRSLVERAARFIYLLQTCFGGTVKQNRQGHFNMSYAWNHEYANGHATYDFDNMFAVSALLNRLNVEVRQASYEEATAAVSYGDFVYMDPPYDSTADDGSSITDNYVADVVSQDAIREHIDAMTSKGAMVLMSNSDTSRIRDIYQGWAFVTPQHRWSISGASKGGQEILIANWRLADRLTADFQLAA